MGVACRPRCVIGAHTSKSRRSWVRFGFVFHGRVVVFNGLLASFVHLTSFSATFCPRTLVVEVFMLIPLCGRSILPGGAGCKRELLRPPRPAQDGKNSAHFPARERRPVRQVPRLRTRGCMS